MNLGGKAFSEGWDAIFGNKDNIGEVAPRAIEIGDWLILQVEDYPQFQASVRSFDDTPSPNEGLFLNSDKFGFVRWDDVVSFADGTPVDIEATKAKFDAKNAETEPPPPPAPVAEPRVLQVGDRVRIKDGCCKGCNVVDVTRIDNDGVELPNRDFIFWDEIVEHEDGTPVDVMRSKPDEYGVGYQEGYADGVAKPRPELFREGYDAGFKARDEQAPAADTLDDYQRRVREWNDHNFPLKVTTEDHQKAREFLARELYGLDDQPLQEKLAYLLASNKRRNHQPLIGACEELGELCHAFLKNEQGIRGTAEEWRKKKQDAVGDVLIYLMDLCNKENLSMQDCLDTALAEVSQRDWIAFPLNGKTA